MSDVSPGRICKFNSAAEPAMSNPVGDYLAPSSLPPRFGQICQFNPAILNLKLYDEFKDDSRKAPFILNVQALDLLSLMGFWKIIWELTFNNNKSDACLSW